MTIFGEEFENKLKEIFFHVARYGALTEFSLNRSPEDFNYKRFYTLCNKGFKIAQNLALEELRQLYTHQKGIEEEIVLKRKEKKNDEKKKLETKLEINRYKIELIKNLVYTIAWQVFNRKREILARFYTDERGNNQLTGKGFEAILSAANEINQDPQKFALITDLTNNIQIGDLLVITPEGHEIIEVKTGEKNEAAKRLINFYKVNDIEITNEKLRKSVDRKFAEQILRMQKQELKTKRLKTIIEEDKGDHPKYENTKVNLLDSPIANETFHSEIKDLLEQLKDKDWAYTSVWGVLNIGVYKNEWRTMGKFTLTQLNNGYPVYDILSLGVNISEPIFAKPISWGDENIIDIALGKIKIFIGIDIDQFIKFANDFGLPMRWSTKKELNNISDTSREINIKELFSFENKGLVITDEETKESPHFVGMGMLCRMIHDHISPLTLIQNRVITFNEFKKANSINKFHS